MSFLSRIVLAFTGTLAAVTVARSVRATVLILLLAALVGFQLVVTRNLKNIVFRYWSVLIFAASIYVLQSFSHNNDSAISIQILFVYSCAWWMSRLTTAGHVPVPAAKPVLRLYLFAHFIRHFTEILGAETRRMLTARGLAAPHLYSRTGLVSLAHSMAAILFRSFTRAERFYAAQCLKGLDV
jgi:hypothetical protein